MNVEKLKQMILDDSKSDRTELAKDALHVAYLYGKYLNLYEDENHRLKRLKQHFKIVNRKLWEYYTGKASPKVYKEKPFHLKLLKTDVALYIQSDSEYQTAEDEIFTQERVVNLLKGAMAVVDKKGWAIKNALDDIKWKQGVA